MELWHTSLSYRLQFHRSSTTTVLSFTAQALPDVISNEIAGRNFKPAQKQIVCYKRLRYQKLYKLFNNSIIRII